MLFTNAYAQSATDTATGIFGGSGFEMIILFVPLMIVWYFLLIRPQRAQAKKRTLDMLAAVRIRDPEAVYQRYPHQVSGGMGQRIMIAMALINKPRLLIADEPTTALDVTVQAQVLELLRDLQKRHNLTMLFISHDLAVVGEVADHIAVMRHGVLLEQAPARELLTHPQHEYTKSLLAAVPTLKTDRQKPLAQIHGNSFFF